MHKKKQILFMMNTLGRAGAERALIELMRLLEPERYEVYLYVLVPRGEMFGQVPSHVRILNRKTDAGSVLSVGGKLAVAGRLGKAALHPACLKKAVQRLSDAGKERTGDAAQRTEKILRRMLADGTPGIPHRFDLAVAYLEGPATWYVAEKIQAKKKVAFLHIDYRKAGYSRTLDQGCYETFDQIFAVSRDVRESFLSVYPEYAGKTSVFFNIINKEYIRKQSLLPGGFTDGYKGMRLLTVGRLYYQKGYDIAVKTAELLRKRGYEFRWYALGEGEERANLHRQIRRAGLVDSFILLGASDNPYPYFRQADIYVCTSRFEGKSIVIEEAQALGKPVVATPCTGVAEQICPGTDGVIAGPDPGELADEIGKLIGDPLLRSRYGTAAAQKEMAWEQGYSCFLTLLQE